VQQELQQLLAAGCGRHCCGRQTHCRQMQLQCAKLEAAAARCCCGGRGLHRDGGSSSGRQQLHNKEMQQQGAVGAAVMLLAGPCWCCCSWTPSLLPVAACEGAVGGYCKQQQMGATLRPLLLLLL
jgi:hypothetical protein